MHLFDLRVARRTGFRDAIPMDAGPSVGVRQDEMRRVTRGAHCRHGQSLSEQAEAVNGLRVVLENAVLRNTPAARHG